MGNMDRFRLRSISGSRHLRRLLLPVFAKVNLGDITIRNPYTGDRFRLHSFKHKGYWFWGRAREHSTMHLFQQIVSPGDRVLEVGGHIGYVSQLFAKLTGPEGAVFVLEPGPNNLPYLKQNTSGSSWLQVVEAGAGAESGTAEFFVESLSGQNNSFVPEFEVLDDNANRAGVRPDIERVSVEVTTLDEFVRAHPGSLALIKIDVEGFELPVLQGALEVLRNQCPVLMVEIQTGHAEIEKIAASTGYRVFDTALKPFDWVVGDDPVNTFWLHDTEHAGLLQTLRRDLPESA